MASSRNQIAVQFGARMRAHRMRAGLSQGELAHRTSLHRTAISLLERGGREPRLDTILKIAGALAVPLDELLCGIEWRQDGHGSGEFRFEDVSARQLGRWLRPVAGWTDAMTPGSARPSRYDCAAVERALLEVAVELHPEHLTAEGLRARIVRDPDDAQAVETAEEAIRHLREFGVLSDTDGGLLGPTPAACRTAALLLG